MHDKIIVLKADLDKLEESRVALCNLFNDNPMLGVTLQYTQSMWTLINRKVDQDALKKPDPELLLAIDVFNSCIKTAHIPAIDSPCQLKMIELLAKYDREPTAKPALKPGDDWTLCADHDAPMDACEVLLYNKEWIDEDFNPDGVRAGFSYCTGAEYQSARWQDGADQYETDESTPTHWRLRPAAPKEPT